MSTYRWWSQALVVGLFAAVADPAAALNAPVLVDPPPVSGTGLPVWGHPEALVVNWQPIAWQIQPRSCRDVLLEVADTGTASGTVIRAAANSYPYQRSDEDLARGSTDRPPNGAIVDLKDGHRYSFRAQAREWAFTPGVDSYCFSWPSTGPEPVSTPIISPWSPRTSEVLYDATAPGLSVEARGRAVSSIGPTRDPQVELRYTASDPAPDDGEASGLRSVTVNGVESPSQGMTTLTLPDGAGAVSVMAVDRAGNRASWSTNYVVDTTGPVIALERAPGSVRAGGSVGFRATVTDTVTGVDAGATHWSFGDGDSGAFGVAPTHVYRRTGVYCGRVTAIDGIGNRTDRRFTVIVGRPVNRLGRVSRVGDPRAGETVTISACVGGPVRATVSVRRVGAKAWRSVRLVTLGRGLRSVRVKMATAGRWQVRIAVGRTLRVVGVRVRPSVVASGAVHLSAVAAPVAKSQRRSR